MEGRVKVPRFVKEYASYKKQNYDIKNMTPDEKYNLLIEINKPIKNLERGMITIEECMNVLSRF